MASDPVNVTDEYGCMYFLQVKTELGKIENISLTHWSQVMYICVSKLTIIGSDNGLSPGQHQAIIWTNTGILLIGPLET